MGLKLTVKLTPKDGSIEAIFSILACKFACRVSHMETKCNLENFSKCAV